jgi:hypothetical protein
MRDALPLRLMLPTATLLLGICAMTGVFLPWAHGWQLGVTNGRPDIVRSSPNGFEYIQGETAFAGAVGIASVSVLYLLRRIRHVQYVAIGAILVLVSVAASTAFWISEVNKVDPISAAIEVFRPPRISAGPGWYLTIASSVGALVCLTAFAVASSGLRLVRDDRNLTGGSLVPKWLRLRLVPQVHTPR